MLANRTFVISDKFFRIENDYASVTVMAVIPFAQPPVEVFAWTPDDAFVISEEGLFHSRVQFGGGYSQVSYKGIARSWKVIFCTQSDHELRVIANLINSRKPFSWTQSPPHSSDGEHPVQGTVVRSVENNGRMTCLECKIHVELIGSQFAQEASKKYGPRDTGVSRIGKDDPSVPPV